MTDERGRPGGQEPDDATGAFNADAWFRSQFGAEQPPTSPSFEPVPTEPAAIIEPEPTQPAEIVPPGTTVGDAATELIREPEPGEALDLLFSEQSFQEYDDALIPAVPRSERRARRGSASNAPDSPGGEPTARTPLSKTQKILLWVAGSLVAVLALVGVFVVGTRIPLVLGPAPGAEPIASPTASPTASADARPVGPVDPGDWRWDELAGGECLEPYVDAWQEEYTVVDCATPHGGQLVLRAELPLANGSVTAGPYPGEEVLATQTLQLCSSAGLLDLGLAGVFTDIVLQAAYPASEAEWNAGKRDYFCFISRSSGEPLAVSLVGPGPAPTALPTPPPAG